MKKLRITKKSFFIAFIVIIILFGVALAWWASTPKKGKVTSTPVTRDQAEGYSTKQLDGKYINFSYSGRYVVSSEPPRDGNVELHMLRASTTYDKQISVLVAELPNGDLGSYGQYLHRKKRTDLYQNRKVVVSGQTVDVWVNKQNSEQTAFIPKGELVATLSFNTANQNDNLATEVDEVLKTFSWKQ